MQWLLIDGNNWFARDWFAAHHTTADMGQMFLRRLDTLVKQFDFDRAVIAWDSRQSFRKDLSESYKTHREAKPEEFGISLARTRQAIVNEGFDCLESAGFEADDVLATIVSVAHEEGARAVLCSSDADLHQLLVTGSVSQATSWKRITQDTFSLKCMTADKLLAEYGVKPHQWVDYRVIVGDTSDGIKGVDGLGPKAARTVIESCGTLERFYSSPFSAGISDRQRNLLLKHRPNVDRARQLLTLRRDVPLPASWFASILGGAPCKS